MAKGKSTIGANPLDSLLGSDDREKQVQREKRERLPHSGGPVQPVRGKVRLTVHVPVEVSERAKNAVFWTPGLTLADLAERALRNELDRIEAERGTPFSQRENELRGGRPIKG